jgi:hypothetical protein
VTVIAGEYGVALSQFFSGASPTSPRSKDPSASGCFLQGVARNSNHLASTYSGLNIRSSVTCTLGPPYYIQSQTVPAS